MVHSIRFSSFREDLGKGLDDPDKWSLESLNKAVATNKTRSVFLLKKVPVLLLYLTAYVEVGGQMVFTKDVYNRDPTLLKALNGRFVFRKLPVAGRKKL